MSEEQKQDYGMLVAKKSERLVTALYLVTDLLSDKEPIKHSLRTNSVTLLSSMNALSQLDAKDRFTEFKTSLKSVTEILSLLHVAATTSIISEMNGKLLTEGFRALQLVLEKKQPLLTKDMLTIDNEEALTGDAGFSSAITSTSYDVITPRTLARFHESERDLRKTEDTLKQDKLLAKLSGYKGQNRESIKDINADIIKDNNLQTSTVQSPRSIPIVKDTASVHSDLIRQTTTSSSTLASSFQMRKQTRREQILALFVRGVDVSIKDIAARIRGCSEKTIQRELNALLEDNIIERIGEKRWSRYVLR